MSIDALLAAGRQAAEALMQDSCTIRRRTGEVTDPETGIVTPTYSTIYTGRCRVQQQQAQARPETPGEAYVLMVRREVHVPMAVTGLRAGDEVLMTASAADPDLPGRTFLIRELFAKSHATARRLGVEEQTS